MTDPTRFVPRRTAVAVSLACLLLSACGGGSTSSDAAAAGPLGVTPTTQSGPTPAPVTPPTAQEAARLLTQATFGPTAADTARVQSVGMNQWLEEQFVLPATSHLDFVMTEIPLDVISGTAVTMDPMYRSFWKAALASQDQLRQRVAFALSQILVTSAADAQLNNKPYALAAYMDILSKGAFGNYRDLLEQVTLSPTMGQYLTARGNRGDGGRTPDENYAREIMQLFSIGLVQLNPDGTPRLVNGQPVDTYTFDDIRGLAKVFTGWSWGNEGTPDLTDARFNGDTADRKRELVPMQFYPKFHSPDEKAFLGVTVAAGTPGPAALKTALDTLFNHPNTGPFIATRLIQRLVTSNPSTAYVGRVAAVFDNNGKGVRGDLKAVVRAVLFDAEARDLNALNSATAGKLREPVLRLSAWARAFEATSLSGVYRIGQLDDTLFQTPLRSPTVFNYYRPGYVPPNSDAAARSLVAPEFQITHELSVATYLNTMQAAVATGTGFQTNGRNDVQPTYTAAIALADTPDALVDRVNLLLTYNTMSAATRTAIRDAVAALTIPAPTYGTAGTSITYQGKTWVQCATEGGTCTFTGSQAVIYGTGTTFNTQTATASIGCNNTVFGDPAVGQGKACYIVQPATTGTQTPTNQAAIDAARLNRVRLAAFMTLASPEFLVQK